ncbi:MAG TPA: hypothetical protein VFB13_14260 [Reyranella sp.]|jgi:hypothetical protein|nr:hypothetical protein [Reyranella sp.]
MPARQRIDDLNEKVKSAKRAARKSGATDRAKADLKLLEQQAKGEKLRARHPPKPPSAARKTERKLDKALKDTFPGSDPVSAAEAGRRKDG